MQKNTEIKRHKKAIRRKCNDLLYYKHRVKRVGPCNLTQEEFLFLQAHALRSGRRITPYLKECALAYLKKEHILPKHIGEKITALHTLCRNIATNLNQIARHVNTVKKATVFDLLKAKVSLKKLAEGFENFIRSPKTKNDYQIPIEKNRKL
jgi:hypothetical protein